MKIAIIGYSGSGKSTLAKKLANFYNCPVLHLDRVNFEAGWIEREIAQAKEMVCNFMQNSHWIIEGNYRKLYQQQRLEEADKIIFLKFNRFTCFCQARRRYKKNKNSTRNDVADGCIEKFDFEFAKWILHDGRTKEIKKHYKQIELKYPTKIVILKNRRQIKLFLNNFKADPSLRGAQR